MLKNKQSIAASEFALNWRGRGYEKGQSQQFWLELLQKVLGVENPFGYISFEDQVHLDHTSFIDGYIEKTHVLIEQKSIDKDLRKPIRQSDGSMLNPFEQAKRYSSELPYSKKPRWVVTCNFQSFLIYDMEQPNGEPEELLLKNLGKEYFRLKFLVDTDSVILGREMKVSLQAGEIVGKIYEKLRAQYINPDSVDSLKSLNILCTRLVFCLYAEDANIFGEHNMFHDYLAKYKPGQGDMRRALIDLFAVLDTPEDKRDPYLQNDLKKFPYVNGGLFRERDIEIPYFTNEIATLLLDKASLEVDWSDISPTIFGAVFESTLNPETRRKGGMHYTSVENIHKVIDPLFLDSLKSELEKIKALTYNKKNKLLAFQDKLASLKFFDPACGSGNFLTESYLCLRRLENEVIKELYKGQGFLGGMVDPVKVSINQFYGIEINDFAVTVASTALWIAEAQMITETEGIVQNDLYFLPLKSYSNIIEGNALRINWDEVAPKDKINYILGNPPFIGARMKSKEQAEDVINVFGSDWKNVGELDYVACWYKRAVEFMQGTTIKAALVSTNSITQGEQVACLWKPLMNENGLKIDFAYQTFRWDSEASLKAHVHCVIVGFGLQSENGKKTLFTKDGGKILVENINAYLVGAPNVFVESRNKSLCAVPPLLTGSQRIDDDNFMFDEESKKEFLNKEPSAEKYFKVWYGAEEFIHNRPRWCLYLGKCSPSEIQRMPHCLKIIEAVRAYRLASKRTATVKAADYPSRFGLEVFPESNFMIVPVVSSERRRYIPIGFMSPDNMCSNQVNLIPDATLYHFGVITSNVHMAWVNAICGRLKSDYRYSKDIVYNNYPWPSPTESQRTKIEQTAQGILDARLLYSSDSLAALYDDATMPIELRKAHQANDRAVMEAYGFDVNNTTDSDIVAKLLELYQFLAQ